MATRNKYDLLWEAPFGMGDVQWKIDLKDILLMKQLINDRLVEVEGSNFHLTFDGFCKIQELILGYPG